MEVVRFKCGTADTQQYAAGRICCQLVTYVDWALLIETLTAVLCAGHEQFCIMHTVPFRRHVLHSICCQVARQQRMLPGGLTVVNAGGVSIQCLQPFYGINVVGSAEVLGMAVCTRVV
jgi:hypothetical protein